VVARPTGARIRTRLRPTVEDQVVIRATAEHLGHLASADLAWRCRLGRGPTQRAARKRALTAQSSSRWAGTITRTSNDQWQRALSNLIDRRASLRRGIRIIRSRLAVPVGSKQGRVRGFTTMAERSAKRDRLNRLTTELVEVEERLAAGNVSVCRGGRRLANQRHHLELAHLSKEEWCDRWQAARWFLTADGDAAYPLGNGTIQVHPDHRWLELRLPAPLAHLANRPHGRYRLANPVFFTHREQEWAARVTSGAVRYDISLDAAKGRWYLDASWQIKPAQPPSLEELQQQRAVGVDLNADHLACWTLDGSGNPSGQPHTIPLEVGGLPASARDGRLQSAVATLMRLATSGGCRSIVIEDLDFADVRQAGREALGRGRRGKRFRRVIAGIPTRRFRAAVAGMAANNGLWVIAVDPGWTSRWGRRYWQAPLSHRKKSSDVVTGHHAAAVVIGRRGLGLGARRRPGVSDHDQRIVVEELPARPNQRGPDCEGPGPPAGQRAAGVPAQDPSGHTDRARRPGGPGSFGTTGAGRSPAL
jgi:hypothetical protein